jgi:hypothetical protein
MQRPGTSCAAGAAGGGGGGGGGGTFTFSDGLTADGASNVTNDLVTGALVAQVDAHTTIGGRLQLGAAGAVLLRGAAAVARLEMDAVGEVSLESAAGKDLHLDAGANLSLTGAVVGLISAGALDVTGAGNVTITAGAAGSLSLLSSGGGHVNVATAGASDVLFQVGRNETHTIQGALSMVAKGATGAALSAEIGNLTLDAGTVDDTAETRIMPRSSAPAPTLTFRIWDGSGAGQATMFPPAGGTVVDFECRSVLFELMNYLRALGWIAIPDTSL